MTSSWSFILNYHDDARSNKHKIGSITGHKQTAYLLCLKERLWEAGKCKYKDNIFNKYVQNNVKGGEKDL